MVVILSWNQPIARLGDNKFVNTVSNNGRQIWRNRLSLVIKNTNDALAITLGNYWVETRSNEEWVSNNLFGTMATHVGIKRFVSNDESRILRM